MRSSAGSPSCRFLGVKGTTGTQASFLALFEGDDAKVEALDRMVAAAFGFERTYPVSGQTYSRKIDSQVLGALAGIAESAHRFGTDLRLLAHERELEEPFEAEQIGSSAMAYKRNPMRAERLCSLARFIMALPAAASQTAATQWLERTLDDSAVRRLILPQGFLAADAVLSLYGNIAAGLVVHPAVIGRHVAEQLPFMATENLLMAAVLAGGDRQTLHERIRVHALAAAERLKEGASENDLIDRLREDPAFPPLDFETVHGSRPVRRPVGTPGRGFPANRGRADPRAPSGQGVLSRKRFASEAEAPWPARAGSTGAWRGPSNARRHVLTGLAQSLQFLTPSPLARLLVVGFPPHFFTQSTSLAQLAEAANRFLNGLTRTDP